VLSSPFAYFSALDREESVENGGREKGGNPVKFLLESGRFVALVVVVVVILKTNFS
jgi:hypothetical protein